MGMAAMGMAALGLAALGLAALGPMPGWQHGGPRRSTAKGAG